MSFQIGNFSIPTPGDAVMGAEALVGNLVEGVIEATTGQTVELTPGNGVDNSRVKGPRGSGEIQFDKKMASHEEFEKLRKEVQGKLRDLSRDVAKVRVQVNANQQLVRRPTGPFTGFANTNNNNLLPLIMMTQGKEFASNPLSMILLTQAMQGSSLGTVGGQPIQVDLTTIAMLATVFGGFGQPARTVTAAPAGGPT